MEQSNIYIYIYPSLHQSYHINVHYYIGRDCNFITAGNRSDQCTVLRYALVSVRYGLNTNIIYTLITCVHISHNALVLCHLSIVSIAPALLLTVEHFDDDQLGQVNWTPHASKLHTIVEIFNCKLPIFSTYNIHNTYMYEMLQLVSHFIS